jgi:hypothetical protein
MPNHVENIVTFEGNEKDIKELMNCLVIEGEPSTEGFCPMPTELRGTTSPSKVKDQVLINFIVVQLFQIVVYIFKLLGQHHIRLW